MTLLISSILILVAIGCAAGFGAKLAREPAFKAGHKAGFDDCLRTIGCIHRDHETGFELPTSSGVEIETCYHHGQKWFRADKMP